MFLAFERFHGGIAIDADDKDVPQAGGLEEELDMAAVQNFKAAVGPHDGFALAAPMPARSTSVSRDWVLGDSGIISGFPVAQGELVVVDFPEQGFEGDFLHPAGALGQLLMGANDGGHIGRPDAFGICSTVIATPAKESSMSRACWMVWARERRGLTFRPGRCARRRGRHRGHGGSRGPFSRLPTCNTGSDWPQAARATCCAILGST